AAITATSNGDVENMKARTGGLVLLLAAGMLSAQAPQTKPTPVPRVAGPIPVTRESRMFMSSLDSQTPLNLPAYGYMEQEYFLSGTANVYDWDSDGTVKVQNSDAPYATRIVVRRPIDAKRLAERCGSTCSAPLPVTTS